jgi:maltooligosyltrehalose trehalohydrolase
LGDEAFVLRFLEERGEDRILLVNLGGDLDLQPVPEPLLAPGDGREWELYWSSEFLRYGGSGIGALVEADGWCIPAESAVVMRAIARSGRPAG